MTTQPEALRQAMLKIIKWTVKAEDALSRKKARKALRKVAKWSTRLSLLQSGGYIEGVNEEGSTHEKHPCQHSQHP